VGIPGTDKFVLDPRPLMDKEIRNAGIYCATMAKDIAELKMFLMQLGLLPDPETKSLLATQIREQNIRRERWRKRVQNGGSDPNDEGIAV
jgi:hypothetical protein